MSTPITAPAIRFAAKFIVEPMSGCHLWTSQVDKDGYGRFWDGTKKVGAHRWAWEQVHGPIPAGLEIDHLVCSTAGCVNAAHMVLATTKENVLRSNGTAAKNARKSKCSEGHPYDLAYSWGGRGCRVCRNRKQRTSARSRYHRRRAAQL